MVDRLGFRIQVGLQGRPKNREVLEGDLPALGGRLDIVGQIIRPTAEGVHAREVVDQISREQRRKNAEILARSCRTTA